jgi:sugar lactone lactonase YvrE
MRRIVGQRQPGAVQFRVGPCHAARLAFVDGLAVLPDGSLIVADLNANALVKVTDPTGAGCAVSFFAGTGTAIDGVIATDTPNQGASDGTGAAASFRLPSKPVATADGTVYVLDLGNSSIRKVTTDGAAGVVTTVPFALPDVQWNDLALHGDKLVVVGQSLGGVDSLVVQVDPATGAHDILLKGGGERFPPSDPYRSALISAVASDGKRIYIAGSGRIWRLAGKGRLVHVAGGFSPNDIVDFPLRGYDPAVEHPALELQLKHSIGDSRTAQFLTYDAGSLYWTARAYAEYVVQIACID